MERNTGPSRLQATLIILACVACVVVIVFLKTASDRRSPLRTADAASDAGQTVPADTAAPVAVPDVRVDTTVLPATPDTVPPAPADSIGKDTRPAREAGRQDGYLAAEDDAQNDRPRASYDDTNTFPTPSEQHAYKRGYAEGYARGLAVATSHHAPQSPDDQPDEAPDADEAPKLPSPPHAR